MKENTNTEIKLIYVERRFFDWKPILDVAYFLSIFEVSLSTINWRGAGCLLRLLNVLKHQRDRVIKIIFVKFLKVHKYLWP